MVNNFRGIATHVALGVTKQLTASHRAKEKVERRQRWSKRIHQRQRQRNEQL